MGKTRFVMGGGLLLVAALLTMSCASMRMTDEWRDRTFQRPPYKKVMVVALTKRADLRQPVEDEFSRRLKERGGEAALCYEYIPDVDKISREELIKVSAGKGIEAYLVFLIMRTETRIESHRASNPAPQGGFGTDSMMTMHVWGIPEPPVTKRIEVTTLSARLFDGDSAKLIWQSTIESVDSAGDGSGIPRFVRTVMDALDGEKLIPHSK
jgi:hypothetical protein